jgi:hypothetical protein
MHPFKVEGASMSVRNTIPLPQRSRSTLDHCAIDMAARLLVAAIWLERQFGKAPKLLTISVAESGMSGPVSRVTLLTSGRFLGEGR